MMVFAWVVVIVEGCIDVDRVACDGATVKLTWQDGDMGGVGWSGKGRGRRGKKGRKEGGGGTACYAWYGLWRAYYP